MRTLTDINMDNEIILTFITTGSYNSYELLFDNDYSYDWKHADIGASLEYTLHRMKEEGFTDKEINFNCNMSIPTEEEMQDLEEFGEYISIDLGYVLNGLISHIEEKTTKN